MIDFFINKFRDSISRIAFIYSDKNFSYDWLINRISFYTKFLINNNMKSGDIVAIESQTSPESIALFFALAKYHCIIVPITNTFENKKDQFYNIAQVDYSINLIEKDIRISKFNYSAKNILIQKMNHSNSTGLILFSSGTSGENKAVLHDLNNLMIKYKKQGKDFITLCFMHFDHIGGIDTILYSLSNSSTLVITSERGTKTICQAIEKHKVEVLPVTPTFLNLLLLSEDYRYYNLSSLKYITYGTEIMPEFLLKRYNEILPGIKYLQKYGTTELGTLRSKSLTENSTWVKIGGEEYQTRVVDGILQIKSKSSMKGYLNAPSPFTDDGWFITGDQVEVEGEFIRFLGRKSEIINVGGEKVFPGEIENIILEIKGISDVIVYGEKNPLIGNIVCAKVSVITQLVDSKMIISDIKKYCCSKLPPFKVPVKIIIVNKKLYSDRLKKIRN